MAGSDTRKRNICGGSVTTPPVVPDELTPNRFLGWMVWSQRWYILVVIITGSIWIGLQATIPAIVGWTIDNGIGGDSRRQLAIGIVLVAAAAGGLVWTWVLRHRTALGIHLRTYTWLCQIIGARGLDTRGGLDGNVTPGELVSHLSVDARRVAHLMDVTGRGTGCVLTFSVVVGLMFTASWQLAGALLAVLVPMIGVLLWRSRVLERRTHRQQAELSTAGSVAADAISGVRVVKGVGGEDEAIRRYDERASAILKAALWASRVRAETLALDLMMPVAVVTVVAWLGGRLTSSGDLTVGQLVTFSGWSIFLVTPLMTFGEVGRKWAMGRAGAARIVRLLDTPHAHPTEGDVIGIDHQTVVALEDVTIVRNGQTVVEHFSLHPKPDVITAIVCDGDTTAALAGGLGRLFDVDAGRALVAGADVRDWQLHALRQTVLVAEHDAVLFEGSLRDNLRIADPMAGDAEMLTALNVAGADDIVEQLDGGLDGPVFERGRSLSGGQRQRVALARSLLADPPVLVLIDPTSALDAYTESEIVNRLPTARAGRATIIFTASPALVSIADDIVLIDNGRVIGRGTHDELRTTSREYRALLSGEDLVEEAS